MVQLSVQQIVKYKVHVCTWELYQQYVQPLTFNTILQTVWVYVNFNVTVVVSWLKGGRRKNYAYISLIALVSDTAQVTLQDHG